MILNLLLWVFFIYLAICALVCLVDTILQNIRKEQPRESTQQRKTNAMREFAREKELGKWSWINICRNEVKLYVNNSSRTYQVQFDIDANQRRNRFTKWPKLVVTRFVPLAATEQELQDISEPVKVAPDMQASYYSGLLASNHKALQELAEHIRLEGPKWIKGSTFNNNDFPEENELKILIGEFEKLGFAECGVNFSTGEFRLDLLDR